MRPIFLFIIAMFGVIIPSSAQLSLPPIEERVEARFELRLMPRKPDTIVNVTHADRMTTHSMSGGLQLIVLTGSVRAEFVGHQIVADRIEYDSELATLVATGNVVVTTGEEVLRVERYEWNRNTPESPVDTAE